MKYQNRRISIYIISLIIVLSHVSGCASGMGDAEQIPTTITPSALLPVIENTPTPVPTIDNSPLPTSQSTQSFEIDDTCLLLEDSLPSDIHLTGVWVRQKVNPYLENLEENTKYRIPLHGGGMLQRFDGHWSISPNGEWLAYLDAIIDNSERIAKTNGYSLRVIHSSGRSLSLDYWPVSFSQTIQGWVDNQNLLLRLDKRDIVLNPFSGRWYELKKPDWLEDSLDKVPWLRPYQYGPGFNHVIVHLNDYSEMRDFYSGKSIFGNSDIRFFTESTWSSDGVMLAIAADRGRVIYIFQNNVEILRIDLVQSGLFHADFDGSIFINLEWSLNNQRLLVESLTGKVLVLDIGEKKVYSICFVDKDIKKGWSKSFFSATSGQYILTSRHMITIDPDFYYYQSFDVLVDIKNTQAYKLPTLQRYDDRIGWLALP